MAMHSYTFIGRGALCIDDSESTVLSWAQVRRLYDQSGVSHFRHFCRCSCIKVTMMEPNPTHAMVHGLWKCCQDWSISQTLQAEIANFSEDESS